MAFTGYIFERFKLPNIKPLNKTALSIWLGFSTATSGKEPACQCRRLNRCRFDPWARKSPWMRAWQHTPIFIPGGKSQGQRSLAGYGP